MRNRDFSFLMDILSEASFSVDEARKGGYAVAEAEG